MTAAELRTALDAADERDEVWALVVRHEQPEKHRPALERQDWTGNALAIRSVDELEDFVREALLSPAPVSCQVAAAVGIDLLNECPACSH